MQFSCDYSSSMEVSSIEDSRYAFFSSYEVLRDRYNKLKGEYRNLLTRKTCCRCATPVAKTGVAQRIAVSPKNLHLDTSSKEDLKSRNHQSVDSCHSPETADLIHDFSLLRERLARVLSTSVCESDSSALSNAVDSLYKLKRQMSFSCDPEAEDFANECKTVKTPEGTPRTSELPSPESDLVDSSIIQEEMESLIAIVNKQREELKFFNERLQHQHGMLVSLISRWQDHKLGAENDVVDVDEWSFVLTN